MERKWSKTPKHILRKKCIEHVIRNWKPSNFIEFGAGTGDITALLLMRGFYGKCYDIGEESRIILRKNLIAYIDKIQVIDTLEVLQEQSFDYLFAFEVLEHITNDFEILQHWSSYLKPKGKILISVPAHMKIFSKEDERVGHVRRYEKEELHHLLLKAEYTAITILNYGFPLGNITRIISNLLRGLNKKHEYLSLEERSIKSGIESTEIVNKLSFLFNDITVSPFSIIQRYFLKRDWSDGYIAYAEKL